MTEAMMRRGDQAALDEALAFEYPIELIADPGGGYVVVFPDLPGCMTQAECLSEVPAMADEARKLWIRTEFEDGHSIPRPSYPPEYSGKFQLRLPTSLHRNLAESAEYEGVSLNTYVVSLLARADAESRQARNPGKRRRSA
jgi:predicted RNase H-like HicB family nuclease